MDWSCEEKKEYGAEGGERGGQYEQDDVENKRGMEWTDGTEGCKQSWIKSVSAVAIILPLGQK